MGQTATTRSQVARPWDPERLNDDGTAASPPYLGDADIAALTSATVARRYQEKIGHALRQMAKYFRRGGVELCYSDMLRENNGRRTAKNQPNLPDSRRCPRCFSMVHCFTKNCPVSGDIPPLGIATQPHDAYMTVDGRLLKERGTAYCGLCFQWGHQSVHCIICNFCHRWGHSFEHCGADLEPPP